MSFHYGKIYFSIVESDYILDVGLVIYRYVVLSSDVKNTAAKPSYQSLANEYIEPPLRIRYKPVNVDGREPIVDASLSLVTPNHNAFYVADTLPRVPRKNAYADRTTDEIAGYPSVSLKDDLVCVIPCMPRICAHRQNAN